MRLPCYYKISSDASFKNSANDRSRKDKCKLPSFQVRRPQSPGPRADTPTFIEHLLLSSRLISIRNLQRRHLKGVLRNKRGKVHELFVIRFNIQEKSVSSCDTRVTISTPAGKNSRPSVLVVTAGGRPLVTLARLRESVFYD